MKTQLSAFIVLAMIITSGFAPAPTEKTASTNSIIKAESVSSAIFSSFSTHRQGKGVALTWGVVDNAGVVSFSIQKTYEDPTDPYAVWEHVTSLPDDGSKFFRYTDESVFPGLISYKITATLIDGTTADSEISTVQIISR